MVNWGALPNRLRSEVLVRAWARRGLQVGRDVRMTGAPIIEIAPSSTMRFGDRVHVVSSAKHAVLGLNHPAVLRTKEAGAVVELGNDVGITGATIVAVRSIVVGAGTMLGANVTIADTDFHPIESLSRRHAPRPEPMVEDSVTIGRNVFIGTGSIVLKGVTIGDNCVIGAGSVVSSDIPANSVAAGVPARVLRSIPGGR